MLTSPSRVTHRLLLRPKLARLLVFLLLSFCTATVQGQNPVQPKRGFYPAGSYALSEVETINTTSGNIIFRLPIVSLPTGRGATPGARVGLFYNSKIWETFSYSDWYGDTQVPVTELKVSDSGGWRYGFKFDLQLVNRIQENSVEITSCDQLEGHYVHKLRMKFPDGSEHVFRPRGQNDVLNDDYFRYRPDGWSTYCLQDQPDFTGTMVYYSADGTYMRLDILHDSDANWANNPWTLYLPDGSRITGGNAPQRIYDRNNNYVEIQNITYNNHPATKIVDQLDRYIIVEYGPAVAPYPEIGRDFIHAWRTENGQQTQLTWTVKWRDVYVNKGYYRNNLGESMGIRITPSVVGLDELVFPAQSGGLSYRFTYNPDNPVSERGWGEVSTMTVPSGAQVKYQFVFDGFGAPNDGITAEQVLLLNQPTQKDLTYQLEYDGSSTPTTETWQYEFLTTESQIIAPDGGITREYFFDTTMGSIWESGLSYKTVKPDGMTIERIWKQNIPYDYGNTFFPRANSYLKTEFISIKNAAGSLVSTAIKDYTYEKNGNLTQEAQYDWVSYGSVQRNQWGNPTGAIPPGAPVKRVTVNDYFNQTPPADWNTYNPNIYTQASSPSFRQALQASEVRWGFADTTALTRKEITYDNPSTTGNPIEEKNWDSTEGGLTRPLNPSNSISEFQQYDSFGNITLLTDSRGNQTQNIYDPVNGFTNLYPTETKVALGSNVQRRKTAEYDFHSGLVTRSTDSDNNVSTATTYDVFGRPTLVRSAEGKPEETHTVTEYSDVHRRLIVKSDLNTLSDGKLVNIKHYDQMGRVRLERQLEDAATQNATDEATGIKVQTRYMYSGSFSFTLTSNPYRAATSTTAGSESTMGWTRHKYDTAGRIVEMENFGTSGLPSPWGTNTTSTGKATTAYDANFTTVTDQAQNPRRNMMDGLGRLVRVDEPDGNNLGTIDSPLLPTSYAYDALENLTMVTQGVQSRTFVYSSLSRLISASNPEMSNSQGVPIPTTNQYDENGNLTQRIDARNVITTYTYDALNRATSRSYSDGTPAVTYTYDGPGIANAKGRLTSVSSSVSTYSHNTIDALGRVTNATQSTNGQNYVMSYTYDLAGNMKSQIYPSGRVVTTDYDSAGRVAGVRHGASTYYAGAAADAANRIQYSAHGAIIHMRFGNGLWEHSSFNSRQQPIQIGLATTQGGIDRLKLNYDYGVTDNNGNLRSQTITVPTIGATTGFTSTQIYGYDTTNRLSSASENNGTSWTQNFTYDRYGNRNFAAGTTLPTQLTASNNPIITLGTNRINPSVSGQSNVTYDNAGNLTQDVIGHDYTYEGENKMTTYDGGSSAGGASYSYDGDGKRVKKVVGGSPEVTTVFVYNIVGQLIAEYGSAPPGSGGASYLTSDMLGSPRIVTGSSQEVKTRHDYLPYGEEISAGYGGRTTMQGYVPGSLQQKFTGKERDQETGLDYFGARYYSSTIGRFSSVDPVTIKKTRLLDPQRINLYAYVRGNPLKFLDPTGEDITIVVTNIVTGTSTVNCQRNGQGNRVPETANTYRMTVTNESGTTREFNVTRDTNFNGPVAQTRGNYGTNSEAPPGNYRGHIRNEPGHRLGWRVEIYDPNVPQVRNNDTINAPDGTQRTNIQIHQGPGCSQGCIVLNEGVANFRQAVTDLQAEDRRNNYGTDIYVNIEDRNNPATGDLPNGDRINVPRNDTGTILVVPVPPPPPPQPQGQQPQPRPTPE